MAQPYHITSPCLGVKLCLHWRHSKFTQAASYQSSLWLSVAGRLALWSTEYGESLFFGFASTGYSFSVVASVSTSAKWRVDVPFANFCYRLDDPVTSDTNIDVASTLKDLRHCDNLTHCLDFGGNYLLSVILTTYATGAITFLLLLSFFGGRGWTERGGSDGKWDSQSNIGGEAICIYIPYLLTFKVLHVAVSRIPAGHSFHLPVLPLCRVDAHSDRSTASTFVVTFLLQRSSCCHHSSGPCSAADYLGQKKILLDWLINI